MIKSEIEVASKCPASGHRRVRDRRANGRTTVLLDLLLLCEYVIWDGEATIRQGGSGRLRRGDVYQRSVVPRWRPLT
jgi:hypothetical protein